MATRIVVMLLAITTTVLGVLLVRNRRVQAAQSTQATAQTQQLPRSLILEENDGEHRLRSHAWFYRSDYSTLMATEVTTRSGPSKGGHTTAWISLPCLATTKRRFTNPPLLGRSVPVPVQSALI
jgi:hypothetical protein